MKTHSWLFLAVVACSPAGALAQSETRGQFPVGLSERVYSSWTIFEHPRYGYALPVPPGVRSVGEPEEAVRTTFVSPDGAFVVTAWGGLISQPPQSVIHALWTRSKDKPGRTVNYQRKAPTWFVVSGNDAAGTEFYEKFTMRGNHVAACTLTYPRSRLREFDPWVRTIEKNFRPALVADATPEQVPAHLLGADRIAAGPENSAPPRELPPGFSETYTSVDRYNVRPRFSSRQNSEWPVDHTPPSESLALPSLRLEAPIPSHTEESPASATKPEEKSPEIPYGEKVPGKPGFVYTPFYAEKTMVDVEGIAAGTKVACPYTGKVFRVP